MRAPRHLLTSLLLCSATAFAQSTAPGLWEVNNKMGGNPQIEKAMADMQKQLAAMPAAQRKQMEAMLASKGVGLGAASGQGIVMKICITPEMAAKTQLPSQTEGDCTSTVTSRSGNAIKSKFVCNNPPATGEGTYTFNGDKAYASKMVMQTSHNGQSQTMTMEGEGKWLSNDCGAVKPIQLPKK